MTKAVVFLPGITGLTLFYNNTLVWPSVKLILRGKKSAVADKFMDASIQLDAKELVQDIELLGKTRVHGYTKTRKYFSIHGFTILEKKTGWINPDPSSDKLFFEYPYDWRLDLRKIADDLHSFIQDKVLSLGANIEIYFVGHSHGGLLSRTYLMKHGQAVANNVKKQILIGTPNHGSPKAYGILREGRGLFASSGMLSKYPKDIKILAHDLPGIYQLLPNERYGNYFGDYAPLAYVNNSQPENSLRGTYIADESTIYKPPSQENVEKARKHYTLDNDALVKDALKFHKDELKRSTFLPDKTYAIYSTELQTISGLRFGYKPGKKGSFKFLSNGDETVSERSAYDLDGLINITTNKPNLTFTRRFSKLGHSEIQWKGVVLRCILELIK